jgi:plastocyanin
MKSRSISMLFTALVTTGAISAAAQVARADGGSITGTVDAKPAKYLTPTVVYLKQVKGLKHAAATAQIDQKGMTFLPPIVAITAGDTVAFANHDNVEHNVMSPEGGYDLGKWGTGKVTSRKFAKAGVFTQLCKIHPEMLAYVFVGQNPFAAIVDDKGAFTISGIPAGTYEVDVWNPKLKAKPQQIKVTDAGAATAKFALAR